MARLNGWQRLWVLVSILYLLPVVVIAVFEFPANGDTSYHTDDFYAQLKPESLAKLAVSPSKSGATSWFVDPDDVDTNVRMPNGHLLPFRKGVAKEQMRLIGEEYLAIAERAKGDKRIRVVGYALLAWIGPCIALFLLGWAIGWVRRGFGKSNEGAP